MKRRHEKICRKGFQHFLKSNFPKSIQHWSEPENDPPDWLLELDGRRFAVEATSITDFIDVGFASLPSPAVIKSLSDFVDELEQTAIENGILSGAYMVALAPIPNLREHKQELLALFLDYISRTKHLDSAPEKDFGYIRNNHISIVKLNSDSQYIAEIIFQDAKAGHDAQQELETYLKSALQTKTSKLSHIQEPMILLILDAFHYSEISDWEAALAAIEVKEKFEAIVRVSSPDHAQLVWHTEQWLP